MKMLLSCLLALPLLGASGLALADHGHGQGRGHGHGQGHGHARGYDDDHDRGWHGHGRHWERGHRYDGPVVVIRDYDHYRLRTPPRGYHWVRDRDDNFVLVAIATGIILDAVFH